MNNTQLKSLPLVPAGKDEYKLCATFVHSILMLSDDPSNKVVGLAVQLVTPSGKHVLAIFQGDTEALANMLRGKSNEKITIIGKRMGLGRGDWDPLLTDKQYQSLGFSRYLYVVDARACTHGPETIMS